MFDDVTQQDLTVFLTVTAFYLALLSIPFWIHRKLRRAVRCIESGRYEQAVQLLQAYLKVFSKSYKAHYSLAVSYVQLKSYSLAKDHLQRTLAINPRHAESYHLRAICNMELPEKDHAYKDRVIEDTTHVIRLNPSAKIAQMRTVCEDRRDFSRISWVKRWTILPKRVYFNPR